MAFARNKNGRGNSKHHIYESVKKGLDTLLKSFRDDDSSTEYTFSSTLSTEERAYIHACAPTMGMISRSQGKGSERKLTVKKIAIFAKNQISKLNIHPNTVARATQLLQEFPLTAEELLDVLPLENQATRCTTDKQTHADCIKYHMPIIPQPLKASALIAERKSLPTWSHREEILNMISKNKVVMITGDTGSGKTTQVPQYLLELFSERNEPVRIICTQPRRIAAISVAERVANERGEQLGGTVGYQIRLESRMSSKTALMFCTTGILLRTLMYQEGNLERVTHLIIDEVHERDRFVDFLLGVLKSRLPRLPNLRLILMSAALDISVFSNYFSSCPVMHVQGKCFPVTEYFLEDVLELTDHLGHSSPLEIGVWEESEIKSTETKIVGISREGQAPRTSKLEKNNPCVLDSGARLTFDCWIQEAFIIENADAMEKLCKAVMRTHLPVNYRHSQTRLSPLMVAAARGRLDLVNSFLQFGADPAQTAGQWTAAKLARSMHHHTVADFLEKYQSEKAESLLRIYKDRHDEEAVNVDLVLDVLHLIEQQSSEGAVLIFLPGYEEIMNIRDRIMYNDSRFAASGKFEVYTLHSSMQSGDQRRVFFRPPSGKRKIVLSTNLAETSITIDDIVFVIDTGKVKVKSFDAVTGVSALKAEWVPQASAIQRKGRAGRCREGICYHLYSRQRYELFEKYQIPEIFRVPLEELCLQSKNLAPTGFSIAEFIGQVPEAPKLHVIQRAVKMLQWMDALDPWENVTDLGRLLLELPVEPRAGKMLLTATVLHCLDPVLTIVCCLSHRDPFLLPADPNEKKVAAARKLELAAGTLSDHMAMLRAFNLWLGARGFPRKERDFCHRYFLSSATMEIIHQLRIQILDQLRKSGFVRSLQELNRNASSWVAIKACILSGLYPQVARACGSGKLTTRREPSVRLHMTSALLGENGNASQKKAISQLPSKWMVYEEISRYGGLVASLRCVTLVNTVALAIFGGHCRLSSESLKDPVLSSESENGDDDDDDWTTDDASEESEDIDDALLKELSEGLHDLELAEKFSHSPLPDERNFKQKKKNISKAKSEFHLDEWICLMMETNAAHHLFAIRQKWQALFARRMRDPIGAELEGDKQVLDALLSILSKEEEASGLPPSPEFLGIAEMRRLHKSDDFGIYRQPNSRPNNINPVLESKNNYMPNPRLHSMPNSWRSNQRSTIVSDDNFDQNSRPNSARNANGPYHMNRIDPFPKGFKGKDLGNLRYKTGNADMNFMTRSSVPQSGGNLANQERGQWSRNGTNRATHIHDNGASASNKEWRNEVDVGNKNGFSSKAKPKNQFSAGYGNANQTPNFPRDRLPPRLERRAGKIPSESQTNKHQPDQSKRIVPKENAQGYFQRQAKERGTDVLNQEPNANIQLSKRRKRPQKRKETNVALPPTPF